MAVSKMKRTRPSAEYTALAKEVRSVFMILMKHLRRDLEAKLTESGLELSPLAFGVIRLLDGPARTIKDLSDKMMLRPATLVPVVDALAKRHLIKRHQDEQDRRCHLLALTPAGQKILRLVSESAVNDLLAIQLEKIGGVSSRQLCARLKELGVAMIGAPEFKKLLIKSL